MNRTFRLGTFSGLKLLAKPSALIGSLLLWMVLSSAGIILLDLPPSQAIMGGLAATLLHWLSDIGHHLGHAWAARRTGHAMSGILMIWLLAASLYPRDEGELPARVHIRRALGGPTGSFILSIIAGLLALAVRPLGGVVYYVALFFFWENVVVFTLGAFLPLGFTDGSTLLYWWGRS